MAVEHNDITVVLLYRIFNIVVRQRRAYTLRETFWTYIHRKPGEKSLAPRVPVNGCARIYVQSIHATSAECRQRAAAYAEEFCDPAPRSDRILYALYIIMGRLKRVFSLDFSQIPRKSLVVHYAKQIETRRTPSHILYVKGPGADIKNCPQINKI